MHAHPFHVHASRLALAAALACAPLLGQAATGTVTDPAGDFLPSFAGSSASTDLDVLSATVTYNPDSDIFTLSATMAGAVGSTSTGLYVWGVDRGAGTAGFASLGLNGVLFDRVVLLRPDGTGNIGGGAALPSGSVSIAGNTITGVVSGSLLPSTGFAKTDYKWNVWPRDLAFASTGTGAISDFAPNNSTFAALAVPEPGTWALMLGGLGLLAGMSRRRA